MVLLVLLGALAGTASAHDPEPDPILCSRTGETVLYEPLGARTAGCLLFPGDDHAFQVAGETGDRLRVIVQTFGPIDPHVVLSDPSAAVLLDIECDGGPTNRPQSCARQADVVLTHPAPALYDLRVSDLDSDEIGEFVLEVHKIPPTCEELSDCEGVPLGRELLDFGGLESLTDLDHLPFEIGEPERIRVAIWKVTPAQDIDPRIELLDADGERLAESTCAESAPVQDCAPAPETPCASLEAVLGGGDCSDESPCLLDVAISDAGNDDTSDSGGYCVSLERLPEPSGGAMATSLGVMLLASRRRASRRRR